MDRDVDRWFVEEILPHEAALMRYLTRVWRSSGEVSDLRQEAYVRVYESAASARPRSPKNFLFATVRNLMIDRIRREQVVAIDYTQDFESLNVSIDEVTPERRLSAEEELQLLTEALDCLPETTRAAIWLRRVSGLSQREAAQSLGIAEGALEGHMTRGLRRLAKAIASDSMRKRQGIGEPVNQGRERGRQSN